MVYRRFLDQPLSRLSIVACGAVLVFMTLAASTYSAELPAAPALPAVESKDEPGLMLTIESLDPKASRLAFHDTRTTRLLALDVPAGSSPSAFCAAGPFRATFDGDLNLRLRDYFVFFAQGHGKLTLKINDQVVLKVAGDDLSSSKSQEVRLNKGKNHILATCENTTGEASLRLFWIPKGLTPEPVPPNILSHNASTPAVVEGQRIRDGRVLLAELRCTKCHASETPVSDKDAMPELSEDAPSLKDVGGRLNAEWMAAWINNPRSMRARVHMPRIFHDGADAAGIDPRARDVATYLATLGAAAPVEKAPDASKAEAGGRVFTNLNCVACHISPERTGDPQPGADEGRIALSHVKAKFKPGALKQFLLKPEAHYAWISMPNFRLSDDEAESLAAYLISVAKDQPAAGPPGDAKKGQQLVRSAGCTNCHLIDDSPATASSFVALNAIPKDGWSRGCMAPAMDAKSSTPDFGLTDAQRNALLAFAAADRQSLHHDAAAEFADRQISQLRCAACHARDGKESLLATVLDAENQELKAKYPPIEQAGAEGTAPDQRAPILTWAGEKLRPQWMRDFISGQISYKPRYYLLARMPAFASRAGGLAAGLTLEHGCSLMDAPYPPANRDLTAAGQKLAGTTPNESLSCIRCHAVANQAATAPFEAPAPNFIHVTERLRADYYYRWMHNPLRVDPETKMPRFDDDQGKTGITAVFDGDAHKQFDALWNYMLLGKDVKPAQ